MKKSILLLFVLINVFWVANAQKVFEQSAEANIYPVDDSYVREENPTTIYQDSNPTEVQVRYQSDTQKRYAYMKFEIPQNLEGINYKAMLTLWGGNSNYALDMNIVLAENTWSESTLNWENRPTLIPDVVPVVLNLPYPDYNYGYFDADITSLIAGKEGEMVTLVIMHPNINGENVKIFSKDQTDADKKPTLSFTSTDVAVTGVELNETVVELEVGETFALVATVLPSDATDQTVTWASNDETVATVDENGLVTAIGAGEAQIGVTTTDGDFTATALITVSNPITDILPVDDSYVRQENPTTIYQDSNPTEVQVRYQSDTQKRYAYMKFEIPQNLEGINYKAMLTLWGGNSNYALDMNIVLAENTWSESTLNWENRPNLIPDVVPVLLHLPYPDYNYGYFDADITSLITGKEGEMVTLVIMHPNINGENVKIFSKDQDDAEKKPTLSFDIIDPLPNNANLIPNGDFEADSLPWKYGWGAANASFSLDKTSALNGTGSLKIEVINPSTTGVWWDTGIINDFELDVEEGAVYVFSFVSKAAEARKMHFDVKVGDLKLLDKEIELTTDAKKFTYGFTASVSGMVTIQFMPTIHGASVYIDDLSFIKLADQQIPNGDFEADTLPWVYAWGEANANFSIDNNSELNGKGSLMIEVTNPSTTGVWWDAGIKNNFLVYVEKGQKYEFKFDSKAVEDRQMHFDVKVGDIKLLDKAISLTTGKQTFSFPFIASVSGIVTIQWMPTIAGATVFLDNITLTEAALIFVNSIEVAGADNATEITELLGTLQMKATILPENADIQAVLWSVENGTGEATISSNGLLTAVANGTVLVKAISTDGSQIAGETTITISGQVTGVEHLSGQFGIYPNPAKSHLTVSSDIPVKRLEVLSLDGRVLQVIQVNELKVTLSVQSLKTGLYLIRVTDENDQQHVQRFVKE